MIGARRSHLAGALGLLVLGAGDVWSQVSAFADVASGNATYDGLPATTILTFGPTLQLQGPRWSLGAAGTYTSFERGGWSGQGSLAGSWFTPAIGPFLGEVSGRGDYSTRAYGFNTGQVLGQVRAHLVTAGRGMWMGMSGAEVRHGTDQDRVGRWDGGFWVRGRATRVSLSLARGQGFDTVIVSYSPDTLPQRVRSDYTEAAFTVDWAAGPFEIAGGASRRVRIVPGSQTSWQVSGTYWLTPYLGVIAGSGRFTPDLWQAHPGGQYVTLSLRVGLQPAVRARLRARAGTLASLPGVDAFEATEAGPGQWLLRVRAPLAQLVEVAGDFTDWQAVRFVPAGDGSWAVLVPLVPGTYRMNLRVDGGAWAVPPGIGAADDEFSGRVGVLVVAGR